MSTDPLPSMEERLKAQAARRRTQLGEADELHPAHRRMLQEEVRKTYGENTVTESEEKPRGVWFGWLWSRSALVGGLCVVALLFAIAVVPRWTQTDSDGRMDSAARTTEERT